MFVCMYALYAFWNRRKDLDQIRRGAPFCPGPGFRLPGSQKFRAPGYHLYCGGEGILVGRASSPVSGVGEGSGIVKCMV